MKTTQKTITQELQIWAVPRSTWHMENYPNDEPFTFEVSTSKPWESGAVHVHNVEVTLVVPAGIDLTAKAIETLREAIKETRDAAEHKVENLNKQINNLLMLEHDTSVVVDA